MFNKHFNMNRIFAQSKTRQNKERKQKRLSMETLEARVLLSVSPSSIPLEEADASSSTAYVSVTPELTYASDHELTAQLEKDIDFITTENQSPEIIRLCSTDISEKNTNITGNQLLAQGNIITVTTANDTENSSDGVTSLREAIASASAGDTILFSSSLAGQTITLNSTLSISKNLTIDASNLSSKVTISGNNACRVLSISSSTVTLNNLQICNGKLTASNSKGAGIYSSNSNLTLISCNFENNVIVNTKSGGYGGAIYFYTGNLTVESCKFKSNYVTANIGSGGAVNFQGTTVKINNSEFDENYLYESLQITSSNYNTLSTVNLLGGALYFYATNVELTNSNLYHNRATATITGSYQNSSVIRGGGAYIYAASSFLAENVDFDQNYVKTSNNYGEYTNGGGLYLTGSSSSENVMKNCKFLTNGVQSNSTMNGGYVKGGGVYAEAVLQMESCQVSANYAISTSTSNRYAYGGGIYALEGSTFTNTIISGNVAIANYQSNTVKFVSGTMSCGGGVYLVHSTTAKSWSSSKFTNCTIVYNMANWLGGGVYLSAAGAVFRNSIVIDNSSYNTQDVYASASSSVSWTIPLGFKSSYIGKYYYSDPITFTADNNSNQGIASYSGNLFQSAYSKTSYGAGVTVTLSLPITASLNWDLTPVSTNLIDKGDNSLNSTTTDINGNSRIANGTIDIGAIEAGGTVSKVSITGVTLSTNSPKVGTKVTATVDPSGATCTYQWSYSSSYSGTYTNISGATSSSYTPTSTYLGKYLRCTVTGSENYTGTVTQTTTSVIKQDLTSVTLSTNSPKVGTKVTATVAPSGATCTYQWSCSSSYSGTYTNISGETSSSYTPTSTYLGKYLRCTVTGTENYTGTAIQTTTSAITQDQITVTLTTPTNLKSTGKTSNSVSLSWTGDYRASSYTVMYSTSSSFPDNTLYTKTKTGITSTSDTITGLSANTTYYFKVMAVGNGSTYTSSSYGNYTAVTTQPNTTTLSTPTNLKSTGTTSSSVSLSWGSVSNASSYTVMYSTSSSFTSSQTKSGITSTSDTITGLSANTTYYFKVMAVGNGITSSYSDPTSGIKTDEEPDLTDKVSKVYAENMSVSAGAEFELPIYYQGVDTEAGLNSLSLRIHFDSNKLNFSQVTYLYADGCMYEDAADIEVENEDYSDGDNYTGKVLIIPWQVTGNWTGPKADSTTGKALLLKVKFKAESNVTESTSVRFTCSDITVGYTFTKQDAEISFGSIFDVDGDGQVKLSTDGLLIRRYLGGIKTRALLKNAVNTTSGTRTDLTSILAHLESVKAQLDIDDDGQVKLSTDGLLIARYLGGIKTKALLKNAVNTTSGTRTDLNSIIGYISQFMPVKSSNASMVTNEPVQTLVLPEQPVTMVQNTVTLKPTSTILETPQSQVESQMFESESVSTDLEESISTLSVETVPISTATNTTDSIFADWDATEQTEQDDSIELVLEPTIKKQLIN